MPLWWYTRDMHWHPWGAEDSMRLRLTSMWIFGESGMRSEMQGTANCWCLYWPPGATSLKLEEVLGSVHLMAVATSSVGHRSVSPGTPQSLTSSHPSGIIPPRSSSVLNSKANCWIYLLAPSQSRQMLIGGRPAVETLSLELSKKGQVKIGEMAD